MSECVPEQDHQISLNLRCGSCIFFKELKYKKYKDVCEKLGIVSQGRPCKAYLNNAHAISPSSSVGKDLANILEGLSPQKLNALASLVNQERNTRRQGFKYGQIVYIRIYPADYISNYVAAKVIQATKDQVFVSGKGKIRGLLLKDSVLTKEQWVQKKHSLEKKKRLVDPKLKEYTKPIKIGEIQELEKTVSMLDLVEQERAQKRDIKESSRKVNPRTTEISTLILRD